MTIGKPQISPLRCAPVEMTKGRGALPGRVVAEQKLFIDRGAMGLRPTQGDEKRLLFGNYSLRKRPSPLCHLDRSAAQWRDLRFSGAFLETFISNPLRLV
jgi:hypothetical protein